MGRFFDFSRLLAPLAALLTVVALVTGGDLALRAAFGLVPRALTRTEFLNPTYLEKIGSRVAAIDMERRHAPGSKDLAVVVGFSTAREGIVETTLETREPSLRWVNLAGSGASFFELSYYLRPLIMSHLSPRLLVLGVHPAWMAGRVANPKPFDASPGRLLTLLRERRLDAIAEGAKRWSWLIFNRNRVNLNARRALASLRAELFVESGLPLEALFEPSDDAWRVDRQYDGHADAATKAIQMREWNQLRWFDAAHYREDHVEREALSRVLADCSRIAETVIVVWLPETSELRAKVPAVAEAVFREVLAAQRPEPPLLDLREALPDDLFYDHVHPGAAGRARLTETLDAHLDKLRGR